MLNEMIDLTRRQMENLVEQMHRELSEVARAAGNEAARTANIPSQTAVSTMANRLETVAELQIRWTATNERLMMLNNLAKATPAAE